MHFTMNGENTMTTKSRLAGNGLAAAALAVGIAMGSHATIVQFTAGDGSFHEGANWDAGAVPGQSDVAYVSGGTARISEDATVTRLGAGVAGNGTVVQTGGNVIVTEAAGGGAAFFLSGGNSNSETAPSYSRNAVYHLDGGTVDVTRGYTHIGQNRNANNTGEGVLRITDGSFTTRTWTAVGRWTEHSRGHLLVEDDGAMTVTTSGLNVGEKGNGTLTVRNGGSLTVNGKLTLASDSNTSAGRGYVVNGGRVTAAQIRNPGRGKQQGLFVDGGVLSPDCDAITSYQNEWITNLPAFNVGSRGVVFDTVNSVRIPQTVTVADVPERLAASNLVHRWSLNGSLADSVGNQTATVAGEAFTDFSSYTLPGGNKGVGYISLGSDILPKDGSGVTLEIWATQLSAQNYSRVFEIGLNSSHTMSMAWSSGTDIAQDRIGITHKTGSDTGEKYDVSQTGPYSLGIQYHIAWVFAPTGNGTWTITVYKHDAMTGALLASHTYTPPDGWTLPSAPQDNCWLGHSTYNDKDPAASYDEVRVWKQALTEEELAASVRLGPDTTFGAPGAIVKTGYGRLELPSVAGARDVTVEEGALAAGTGRTSALVHRWTFNNGDLEDKAGGGKNAWIVNPTAAGKVIGTNATSVTLPGGAKGTAGHIELGKNVLPSDGSPITIELWATVHSYGGWTRVFTFGKEDDKNKIMLSWNRGHENNINEDLLVVTLSADDAKESKDKLAPFNYDTEYHIAVTLAFDSSEYCWRMTEYKQDAATGRTLGSGTSLITNAGRSWTPAKLVQNICTLGSSTGNDPDANASYNEVRIWAAALTEEQLTQHALLGPDTVPYYPPTGAATSSPLPATARVDVRKGAFLDLCGGTQTAESFTGEGTLMNGTFVATDEIRPGNGGASGTLKLSGASLSGKLVIVPGADGTCGALEADGALDLSNLDLRIADGAELSPHRKYILATCQPGQPITPFRNIPGECRMTYDTATGHVICRTGGTVFYLR